MQENEADREARLRELASKLFFTLKNQGFRFALYRDVDVPEPDPTRRKRHEEDNRDRDEAEDRHRLKNVQKRHKQNLGARPEVVEKLENRICRGC
jgi:hypothetical protein